MPFKRIKVNVKYIGGKKCAESPVIDTSKRAADVARTICDRHTISWREEAFVLCLNSANKVIGWDRVAIGGIDTIHIDPHTIATIALTCTAKAVILFHNHPGGNPAPSPNDIKTTQFLNRLLNFIGLTLVDHIIITDKKHLSMHDEGYFKTQL